MQFTFASWNVDSFKAISNQLSLISRTNAHVVALQEVTPVFFNNLSLLKEYDWAVYSLSLRPPQPGEGRRRGLGTVLLGRSPFEMRSFRLLHSAPVPERTLIAELKTPIGTVTTCSFHIPPGVNWGTVKTEQFRSISTWLGEQQGPVIVGMDANSPKVDHPDHACNQWWRDGESLVLSSTPMHGLRDVLRDYLLNNPQEFDRIVQLRPTGPLAVSYDRGKRSPIPCRYDFILASSKFSVAKVSYDYDAAREAGSDHSMVVARLELHLP
ncbi:MAG: endonuclease/exonuclease/phosphatase family protein [Nitrospiraceae bacterium]